MCVVLWETTLHAIKFILLVGKTWQLPTILRFVIWNVQNAQFFFWNCLWIQYTVYHTSHGSYLQMVLVPKCNAHTVPSSGKENPLTPSLRATGKFSFRSPSVAGNYPQLWPGSISMVSHTLSCPLTIDMFNSFSTMACCYLYPVWK